MTKQQLLKFIKTRNTAHFHSNMQFQIDAEEAGFKVADLGDPRIVIGEHGIKDYEWSTPHGILREHRGLLELT